jgi:hypothetical protein
MMILYKMIISTMTILELSTAIGIFLAGLAGLIHNSKCTKIECGILKGVLCERHVSNDIVSEDTILKEVVPLPKKTDDFSRALDKKN